jgi:hypothetical protein
MKRFVWLSVLIAGLVVAGSSPAAATSISFHVQVNTAPLIGNSSAPFSLDFALTDGSGTLAGPNTVFINDFTFGGGSPAGAPTLTGGVSGSLASSVTLSDSASFFNELFQPFTPGSSLGFDVTMTTNADPVSPDAFAFAILDKNLFNLPTTGLGDSLLLANITPGLTRAGVQAFSTTAPAGVAVSVAAVPAPEPATLLLVGTGLAAAARRRWGQRK